MIQIPPTVKKSMFAGAMTLTMALVSSEEGVRYDAYLDIVGIPTICYGDTKNVRMGQKASTEECERRLVNRLEKLLPLTEKTVGRNLESQTLAALTSFCDNVGFNGCSSSEAIRVIRYGDTRKGCDLLLNWTRAKDKRLALYDRRMRERMLCLIGDDIAHGEEPRIEEYKIPPKWFSERVHRWGLRLK